MQGKIGVYVPNKEEKELCSIGINCEFGICSECSEGCCNLEEDKEDV